MVETEKSTYFGPALALLKKFMRSEARQRKVTHDEGDDCPPFRSDGSDEVRLVLAAFRLLTLVLMRGDLSLIMKRGQLWQSGVFSVGQPSWTARFVLERGACY